MLDTGLESVVTEPDITGDSGRPCDNLAPAFFEKEGPSVELPIAPAMVAASRTKPFNSDHNTPDKTKS